MTDSAAHAPATGAARPATLPGPRRAGDRVRALRGLLSEPVPVLDELGERFDGTFGIRLGPMTLAVVGNPAHVADLLALPTDHFVWGHVANTLRFYVGDGSMIVSDGADHRRRRGAVQPALARRRLDRWIPMIVAETDAVIDGELAAAAAGPIDLFPIGRRLVLRIVTQALFGPELAGRTDELDALIEPAKTYLEQPGLRQLPHPVPGTRRARAREARAALDAVIDGEIARRQRAGDSDDDGRDDVLAMLLAAGPDGTGELSMDEIRDQVVTLIGAGFDTTASAVAWTVLEAASNPTIWTDLRAEADAVLGDRPVDALGRAELDALEVAASVVAESLRLHPPGVFTPRLTTRAVDVGPYRVPKRSMVLWSPYLAGRDPATWPDPTTFDPGRHRDPTPEQAAQQRLALVAFGRGPRQCIGFALAQMELTLITARLAQRVDLSLARRGIPPAFGMVVNRPLGGVPATVTPAAGAATHHAAR